MVDQINDKQGLINHILKRISTKSERNKEYLQDLKNFNKINVNMTNFCGSECLKDFGTSSLSVNEEKCLIQCSRNYYDSLEKGDINQASLVSNSFKL